MPLSSASTRDEVINAYLDNASYDANKSPAQASEFVVACRMLILMIPALASQGGNQLQFSVEQVENQLSQAETWLKTNPAAVANATFFSFAGYRD